MACKLLASACNSVACWGIKEVEFKIHGRSSALPRSISHEHIRMSSIGLSSTTFAAIASDLIHVSCMIAATTSRYSCNSDRQNSRSLGRRKPSSMTSTTLQKQSAPAIHISALLQNDRRLISANVDSVRSRSSIVSLL
jgi:hypothetical protein